MSEVHDVLRAYRGKPHAPLDRAVGAVASRQHGVVSYQQLLDLGLRPDAIQWRLGKGQLLRLHKGVYAVGHLPLTAHGRWRAAVLACPGGVLSHRSAAGLWQLRPSTGPGEVTVRTSGRRSPHGILAHVSRSLPADERTRRDGIPVTTVARTLLDLAGVLSPRDLERALEKGQRLHLLSARSVERLIERTNGRRGAGRLAALLAEDRAAMTITRSELEARFLSLCRHAGLPTPLVNVHVVGFEVDALWPAERLVVELDGYAYHRTRTAFERDRARDAALLLAGYRVVRITSRMLEKQPRAVAEMVRSLLAGSS
jgi:hypothetical protein